MADNLIQKKGESTWYVRLAVPADVQAKLGCKVLIQSLKTGLRSEAMVRRLPILHQWKSRIASVRAGRPLPDGWQDDVLGTIDAINTLVQSQKRGLIGEQVPPLELDPAVEARMRANPRFVAAFEAFVREHLKDGLSGKLRLFDEIGEGVQSLIPAVLARQSIPASQSVELAELMANPSPRAPRPAITPTRLKAFREFREGQKGSPKHIDQQVGRMERLSIFLKERSLPLDFASVAAWIRSIDRAPATLTQHLLSGSAFWQWAVKYDPAFRDQYKDKADPFKSHDVPQGGGRETSGEQREAYTTTQLETLYKGAKDAGNQPLADLILLGSFTGSRIEQLCQLRVEHIIKEDGVPSFDFRGGKNKSSKRIVPIHPSIRPLIDRLVTESKDGFLIPASSENRYGKRSHALSKAFGYLKTTQGFGPLHVFHSMRNTVITSLLRANVPDHIVMEIVGHATGTETHDTYSLGASARQKLKAISKLPTLKVD